jgi:hypothetical protein
VPCPGSQYYIVRAALSKLWLVQMPHAVDSIIALSIRSVITGYVRSTLKTIEYVLAQQDRGSPTEQVSVPCPIPYAPYSMYILYAHIFVIFIVYYYGI